MVPEEVFREQVPWLDKSVFLVGTQSNDKVYLKLVCRTGGLPSYDREVSEVCIFSGGEVTFTKKGKEQHAPPGLLSDAERLCFTVMPESTDPTKMPAVLRDPFWQWILDHMKAAYVMTS